MRSLTLVLAFSIAATSLATAVAAGESRRDRVKERSYDRYERSERTPPARYERRARRARESEMDIIRAESCDPGGSYSSYPAWARSAFTCGNQR